MDPTDLLQVNAFISLMESDLDLLEKEIEQLSRFTENLFLEKEKWLGKADPNRYQIVNNMANAAPNDNPELSSLYISTLSQNHKGLLEFIYITNPLDELFRSILENNPMVSQVYANGANQINRLYPPYDVAAMLEPDLDLTSFNFYYKGDLEHNPEKGSVWVDEIYVDPVGKGWMMSLIHPVYVEDSLSMVLGFDITVNDILLHYLEKSDGQLLIVDGRGTLVAGKTKAIEALSLPPLVNHTYIQTITSDSFRIEDFNLFKSKSQEVRKMAAHFILSKENTYVMKEGSLEIKIKGRKSKKLDWYILELDL